jgi:hypothetical protein
MAEVLRMLTIGRWNQVRAENGVFKRYNLPKMENFEPLLS